MSNIYNVAGSHIYIGQPIARKGNMTAADYAGQEWLEIGGWATAGTIGDVAQTTTTTLINEGRDVKTKGSRNAGSSEHTFAIDESDPGQISLLAAERSCDNYAFRIVWSAGCERQETVTISIAAPGVVTWNDHGLTAGAQIVFATTGTLPGGLTVGTTYYIVGTPTANGFSVSATLGGSPITTTGTQTGTHEAVAVPAGRTRLFAGLVTSYSEQGGDANAAQMISSTIEVNTNIVRQ